MKAQWIVFLIATYVDTDARKCLAGALDGFMNYAYVYF